MRSNRNAKISTECVWSESGLKLEFSETNVRELSTLNQFIGSDSLSGMRSGADKYLVMTTSLQDLLEKYGAPKIIDYLSIDTEGSEFEILRAFDFSKYQFQVVSCEHNFGPNRSKVTKLLENSGYCQIFPNISGFDDWFVHQSLIKA